MFWQWSRTVRIGKQLLNTGLTNDTWNQPSTLKKGKLSVKKWWISSKWINTTKKLRKHAWKENYFVTVYNLLLADKKSYQNHTEAGTVCKVNSPQKPLLHNCRHPVWTLTQKTFSELVQKCSTRCLCTGFPYDSSLYWASLVGTEPQDNLKCLKNKAWLEEQLRKMKTMPRKLVLPSK